MSNGTAARRRTTEGQQMLTLAFLSYRAYADLRPGHLQLAHLRSAVTQGLTDLAPVHDWELVWGPAAYRAPFTVFDENVMYVVRHRRRTCRFAVVIRGTNPVSAFDWLFGDLWTGVVTPWPFGSNETSPDAAVSLSTLLGINVLCHLRSSDPHGGPLAGGWQFIDGPAGDAVRGTTRRALRPFGPAIAGMMQRLRLNLRSDLRRLRSRREAMVDMDTDDRVEAIIALRYSEPALRLRRRLEQATEVIGPAAQRQLVDLMEGNLRLRSRLAPGPTVFEFLRHAGIDEDTPLDVTVTGHSKGGALSSTFALLLAQTRGEDGVPAAMRWDRAGTATVSCYSYAGPTAGNAAFAALSDRVIGDRCHRITNRLDVVPHAWAVQPQPGEPGLFVENVPDIYGDTVHRIPALQRLATAVAGDVGPLGYRHVGKRVKVLPGKVDPDQRLFVEQLSYQHGGAYIELMGLGDVMDKSTFFSPLV